MTQHTLVLKRGWARTEERAEQAMEKAFRTLRADVGNVDWTPDAQGRFWWFVGDVREAS